MTQIVHDGICQDSAPIPLCRKIWIAIRMISSPAGSFSAGLIFLATMVTGPCALAQNVTSVPVGNDPGQVVVNPVTNTIYILNVGDNTVSVINGATNAVTATVPIPGAGGFLQSIAVNPVTNMVYVCAEQEATGPNGAVTVINGTSNAVTATIPAGRNAVDVAINTVTDQIFVVGGASSEIDVIDGATNTLLTTIPTAHILPTTVAVDEATNSIWYGNGVNASNIVTEVGPNGTVDVTLTTDTQTTTSPLAIAVNPMTDLIYVVSQSEQPGTANFLTVVDGTFNSPNVTVPLDTTQVTIEAPDVVAVNQVTDTIYVTDSASNQVTVINGSTNVATTVGVGLVPGALALNTATNQIYVANVFGNTVSVIDGTSNVVTATVPVGINPVSVAINPGTNRIYVANSGSNTISVIAGTGGSPTPTPTPTPTGGGGGGGGGGGSGSARLINISTRAEVGTGANILIPGFVISGSGTETLLIRADGPALTGFGVAGALAQPSLSVFDSSGTVVASNTGWGTNTNPAQISSAASSVGAFALASGSADCALLASLPAGAYTVQVSGVGNSTGVALAEVYEVSSGGTRLANISTRALVGTGANIIIPGFVISGSGSEQLLARGDGPALTGFGVAGALAQPSLSVFDSTGSVIASNTGWGTNTNPAAITSAGASVGAFALASGSADSALVVNVSAGAYTMQLSGVNNSTGVALAEVYEVP
jgi:YVTN family beta-propeller protein